MNFKLERKMELFLKKLSDDDYNKFFDKYRDLFESLSKNISCPVCRKIVKPPFFNLGAKFHQFEGCKDCYEKTKS